MNWYVKGAEGGVNVADLCPDVTINLVPPAPTFTVDEPIRISFWDEAGARIPS
jgi:hypothetical protein